MGLAREKRPVSSPSRGTLAFHFTGEELRLALVAPTSRGEKEILYLSSLSTRDHSEEEILEKFQKVLAELSLTHLRLVGVLSSRWAVMRTIEVPSRDPQEIREIVNLQASRHTPYTRSEIVVDYLNLGVCKGVYTKILLIIVQSGIVRRYSKLADRLQLKFEKICFAPEALVRSATKYLGLESEKDPVCLLHVDWTASDFLVILKGSLLFARSIPIGTQHFMCEKEVYLPRFTEELKRSFESYQIGKIDNDPSSLISMGAQEGVENLDSIIQETLGLPVRRWLPGESMPICSEARTISSNPSLSFLNVLSSALFSEDLKADLIAEEEKLKRRIEEQSKEIIKLGVLSMVCLGLVCAFFLSNLYFREAEVAQLRRRFEPIKREAEALQAAHARIQTVKGLQAARGKSIESLAELFSVVPNDLYVTDIRYDEKRKFSVKGTAVTRSSVYALVDGMEKSSLFRKVQTKYVQGRIEEDKKLEDFQIIALFE